MNQKDRLLGKIVDYKNYSQILLALSTFLYLGIVIKGSSLPTGKLALLFIGAILFLLFAYFFQRARKKCEEQLGEMK
ncbi:YrhC family protein [Fervidibacillus halotolerans]|uniref:YrhC family protein n=1 Tax=Fervidibacillus halotolerans TaxID=2980027 RepID=A0A9E8RWA4_9BACI|nr:YrhC family protein [Fervidibacillus halotolerans]WAA11535.1 YrhC family protein [Fervidibacillus halotolerans]